MDSRDPSRDVYIGCVYIHIYSNLVGISGFQG